MKQMLMNLLKEENGQGMAEYGLILALIAVVCVGALTTLGNGLTAKFTDVNAKLTPAATP
ncbi:Flp/Fap pilin component [Desulforamulus reducens MI-1]|uniref:Flp/Fap pilin component n=1 Tax=Desulforamulus reducens (strain ATCC BAA-1160 / DSM 100696 / MI-1) TaxID=349161 RepID=A4J6C4_DESRM|nr:Flp family type IVb pilin [Desulforamulus reducens]ABO50627.1 Flp/Fap pilin component [Desulforamulus reducens MI-1]